LKSMRSRAAFIVPISDAGRSGGSEATEECPLTSRA
jgi:hypothetical protein